MRILLTGWPSFLHGEATAGDVLSLGRIKAALDDAGIASDIAWSGRFRPDGLHLDDVAPAQYSHVVFACGPIHGGQVEGLHHRFAPCRRIAVGVSVVDTDDPAVRGFHRILPRDRNEESVAAPDLSAWKPLTPTPVMGIVLAPDQMEYGAARRHDRVHRILTDWAAVQDCGRIPLDSRLDCAAWRNCSTPEQFVSVVSRLDALISTRLHGLVLGLGAGVPVIAVDPVSGGGKVSAQAQALGWPAVAGADELLAADRPGMVLDPWWRWCLSADGVAATRNVHSRDDSLVTGLLDELNGYGAA